MIKQLTIKNLAIIDDITIDFESNLNVLTGETGAGKSIIIDAISLIFGARANNDIIAYGKDNAFISVVLYLNDKVAKYIYDNYDIDVFEECIITRTLSKTSKSNCKINGMIVPLHVINEISNMLIDISSQNESQYLFNHKNHLKLLDSYIENSSPNFKDSFIESYKEYLNIKNEYDNLVNQNINDGELEFLEYKYNELKSFNYSQEEIENINKEYKQLQSLSQNASSFEEIISYLDNEHDGCNIQMFNAIKLISRLASNEKINGYYEKFNSLYLDFSDLVDEFKKDFSYDNIDLSKIDELSDEITKINRLKRKYNVNDLLEYKKSLETKIESINNREIMLSKLEKLLNSAKNVAIKKANELSIIRKEYAKKLSDEVKAELDELYLLESSFSIRIDHCELSSNGVDNIEFYMSANKGTPEMPLIKVASGGEVSRIMLGLKTVFTRLSMVDTIIFDEIDTGVSGKVALAMGKKMEKIAKSAQVLAITHLPQVAAMSDYHYYIYKITENDKTKTIVKPLNNKEKETEVARLLSGDNITDSFIIAAKELISSK